MATRGISPEVKWQGCEDDHLPPSSTKVKNGGAIPLLLHIHRAADKVRTMMS
jgi:hypothetical protein